MDKNDLDTQIEAFQRKYTPLIEQVKEAAAVGSPYYIADAVDELDNKDPDRRGRIGDPDRFWQRCRDKRNPADLLEAALAFKGIDRADYPNWTRWEERKGPPIPGYFMKGLYVVMGILVSGGSGRKDRFYSAPYYEPENVPIKPRQLQDILKETRKGLVKKSKREYASPNFTDSARQIVTKGVEALDEIIAAWPEYERLATALLDQQRQEDQRRFEEQKQAERRQRPGRGR